MFLAAYFTTVARRPWLSVRGCREQRRYAARQRLGGTWELIRRNRNHDALVPQSQHDSTSTRQRSAVVKARTPLRIFVYAPSNSDRHAAR